MNDSLQRRSRQRALPSATLYGIMERARPMGRGTLLLLHCFVGDAVGNDRLAKRFVSWLRPTTSRFVRDLVRGPQTRVHRRRGRERARCDRGLTFGFDPAGSVLIDLACPMWTVSSFKSGPWLEANARLKKIPLMVVTATRTSLLSFVFAPRRPDEAVQLRRPHKPLATALGVKKPAARTPLPSSPSSFSSSRTLLRPMTR